MKKLFLLLFMFLFPGIVAGQTDTTFWFVAPDVTSGHSDRPVSLRITSFDQSSSVMITQPANPGFTPINLTVPANDITSVDLSGRLNYIENAPPNTILNFGLLIEASSPVTAYYEVVSNGLNPDIFTLKGNNALGTSFIIPHQNIHPNSNAYSPTPTNPFESLTEIQYFVSRNEKIRLSLMDINGRVVANLIDKYVKGGWHTLIVNGSGLVPGAYILHLEGGGKSVVKTIIKTN